MSDRKNFIPAGTILTITTGAYSDYRDHGPFRVLKDIDKAEVSEAFKDQFKPEYEGETPSGYGFIAWLAHEDYVEDVDGAQSWHAGDYDFEPEFDQ